MTKTETPRAALVKAVVDLVREGTKAVSVDVPGGFGSIASTVAGSLAGQGRPVLLILGSHGVLDQARARIASEFPELRIGSIEEACDVALLRWSVAGRYNPRSLTVTYGMIVLDDRYPDHVPRADDLVRVAIETPGVQVVDVQGPAPRLDLDAKVVLHADGSVVVDRPGRSQIEELQSILKSMDDGRKDYFILVDKKVETATLSEMMAWALRNGGISVPVEQTELGTGLRISTVFVAGLRERNIGPFETYVEGAGIEENYWTWEAAVEGHELQIYRRGPAR